MTDKRPKHFSSLNPEQQRAVTTTEGPVLILAGAGSGKTKCLTHRFVHIVDQELASLDEVLAITFTNKAAQELGGRIIGLLGDSLESFQKNPVLTMRRRLPWVGTFHSVCVRILRNEAETIGLAPGFTILDRDDSLSLIKGILKDRNLDSKQYSPSAIAAFIEGAKNELLGPQGYSQYVSGRFQQIALEIFYEYEKKLSVAAGLDFNDLIFKTVQALTDYPELLAKYQKKFRYVLIDEYQDTNQAQYRLTRLLVSDSQPNLCVVGDDYQSIYAWRGANFRNILNFNRDYPQATIIKLEQNYRSTQTILDGAASIINRVRDRSNKKLWTENGLGAPITIYEADDSLDESRFVVDEVISLKNSGYRLADCAILYRTNAQSRALEEVLIGKGLPYRLVGALRFYERKEIKDLLAYLRFFLNPKDYLSLARIANLPPRGIGPATLKNGGPKLDLFLSKIEGWRQDLRQAQPLAILEYIIESAKLRSFYFDIIPEGEDRWENIEELLNLSAEFERLPDFLEHVALVSDVDNLEVNSEAVSLMTLHSSKGLEFKVVFVVGMEEGILPHSRSLDKPDELDEERRLTYVGMTRAKERLYLTSAERRLIHGGLIVSSPSRFLYELEERLIDRV